MVGFLKVVLFISSMVITDILISGPISKLIF